MMKEHLDPKTTALVIIDMQNDFCHERGAKALGGTDVSRAQAVVPVIERLIAKAREVGVPIVFVQTTHSEATSTPAWRERPNGRGKPDVVLEGTWGAEFYKLQPREGDIVVVKHNYSAFAKTDLETRLRTMGVTSLVITGVATNVCVESTARHAFFLDFHITLVKDGCAGYNRELEEATFKTIQNNFGDCVYADDVVGVWSSVAV